MLIGSKNFGGGWAFLISQCDNLPPINWKTRLEFKIRIQCLCSNYQLDKNTDWVKVWINWF